MELMSTSFESSSVQAIVPATAPEETQESFSVVRARLSKTFCGTTFYCS